MEKDKKILLIAGAGILGAALMMKLAAAEVGIRRGEKIRAIIELKNTGQVDWNFGIVFMIRDSSGKAFYCGGGRISQEQYVNICTLRAGSEITLIIDSLTVPQEISSGNCEIRTEIYQESRIPVSNLVDSTNWISGQLRILD